MHFCRFNPIMYIFGDDPMKRMPVCHSTDPFSDFRFSPFLSIPKDSLSQSLVNESYCLFLSTPAPSSSSLLFVVYTHVMSLSLVYKSFPCLSGRISLVPCNYSYLYGIISLGMHYAQLIPLNKSLVSDWQPSVHFHWSTIVSLRKCSAKGWEICVKCVALRSSLQSWVRCDRLSSNLVKLECSKSASWPWSKESLLQGIYTAEWRNGEYVNQKW